MTDEPKLCVLILGTGKIATSHARAFASLGVADKSLRAFDISAGALERFCGQNPGAEKHSSLDSALVLPEGATGVVIVSTPPATHAGLAIRALRQGWHVLCEKPLAMNTEAALEIYRVAHAEGRQFACCSNRFLGNPATEYVRGLVAENALGNPYHATFLQRAQRSRTGIENQGGIHWFLDKSKNGGGTLMDWSPYDFSMLNHVLRPIRVDVLHAWMRNPNAHADLPAGTVFDVEQHAGATLGYTLSNGRTLTLNFERAACTHGREESVVELECDDGAVQWRWLDFRTPTVTIRRDEGGKVAAQEVVFEEKTTPGILERPLHHFVDLLRAGDAPVVANAEAVFNFACLRAIYDCIESGKPQGVSLETLGLEA